MVAILALLSIQFRGTFRRVKQVPVPATTDRPSWERYRAFLVSQAMGSDLTPAAAGPIADAQARSVFARRFPGNAFPLPDSLPVAESHSDAPLPGGERTADGRTWVVVSRPEDDRSMFDPAERITGAELQRMARSYAPETIHRAPVVLPLAGPSHYTGEYADRVPGQIDGLAFDGYYLWSLVAEHQGGVTAAVDAGLSNRSIRWWPSYPDAGGEPYLRHLAVTAEPAGTSNLGNLDNFFRTEQARRGKSEQDIRTLSEIPTRERSVSDLPTQERSFTMSESHITLDPNALVEALRTAAAAKPAATAPPAAPAFDAAEFARTLAASTGEVVRTAVAAATKPLEDRLAAYEQRTADAEKAARKERVTAALDTAVRSGRMTPQERTTVEPLLLSDAATPETVGKALAEISQRTVLPFDATKAPILVEGADGKSRALPKGLVPPGGNFRAHPTVARATVDGFEAAQAALRAGKSPQEASELARAAMKAAIN